MQVPQRSFHRRSDHEIQNHHAGKHQMGQRNRQLMVFGV